MTFSLFFTAIYGWIGVWATATFLLMISRMITSRRDIGFSDLEIAAFRGGVGVVCLSVFLRRVFDTATFLQPSPWLIIMVFTHTLLAIVVVPTFFRVLMHIIHEGREHELRPLNTPD